MTVAAWYVQLLHEDGATRMLGPYPTVRAANHVAELSLTDPNVGSGGDWAAEHGGVISAESFKQGHGPEVVRAAQRRLRVTT